MVKQISLTIMADPIALGRILYLVQKAQLDSSETMELGQLISEHCMGAVIAMEGKPPTDPQLN